MIRSQLDLYSKWLWSIQNNKMEGDLLQKFKPNVDLINLFKIPRGQ